MITQKPERARVSPETNLTLAERCADPAFQQILSRAHPDFWGRCERKGLSAVEISKATLRMLCDVETDDEVSDRHPEVRALFVHLDRERSQVADESQPIEETGK